MKHFYINGKFLTQPMSGVQRYAAEISKHLSYLTADFSVVTSSEKIQAGIIPENNIVRIGQRTGPLWEQFSLPEFLNKQHHPLLLNLCNVGPVFYKNKIVCIHDISFIRNPSWFSTSFYLYYKTIIPLLIKSSKHLITVSEFSRSEIMDYYKIQGDKISVIPGGIASTFLPSDQLAPASISLQQRPFFLFVGSLDPRKNLLTLLKAFVQSGITNTALIVVGASNRSFSTTILKAIEEYRNHTGIYFYNETTDEQLASLYKNAKALILPSYYEGFGLPIIEALSVGCPVIVSDIRVFREVAEDNALYFDPTKIDELIGLLKQSAEGPGILKNTNIMASITAKYSWNTSANKLLSIINTYQE